MRALIVEDELDLARSVERALSTIGFQADVASCISDARDLLDVASYDLVVLDRKLPDGDGLSLIRKVRSNRKDVPILVLSAISHVEGRVAGLNAGSDDYIGKPFDRNELIARVRALLRRPGHAVGQTVSLADITFDPWARSVCVAGAEVILTGKELNLVTALLSRANRVVLLEHLLNAVYGQDNDIGSNALDAMVSRLRKRLIDLEADAEIVPVRGVGYMMVDRR